MPHAPACRPRSGRWSRQKRCSTHCRKGRCSVPCRAGRPTGRHKDCPGRKPAVRLRSPPRCTRRCPPPSGVFSLPVRPLRRGRSTLPRCTRGVRCRNIRPTRAPCGPCRKRKRLLRLPLASSSCSTRRVCACRPASFRRPRSPAHRPEKATSPSTRRPCAGSRRAGPNDRRGRPPTPSRPGRRPRP